MPAFRVFIAYSLPEYFDVESDDEEEAIDIVSEELAELVDLDLVTFEVEKLEEDLEKE